MLAAALPPQDFQSLRAKLPADVRVEVIVGASYDGQAAYIEAVPASLAIVMAYGASLHVDAYQSGDEENSAIKNAEAPSVES